MFIMQIPFLSLDQIASSGQCFRWKKVDDEGNKYIIFAKEKCIEVSQRKNMVCFRCPEEDFWNIWWEYFDLEYDYSKVVYSIDRYDHYLRMATKKYSGIRILKQDLWEVMISFIISQQNNIPKIKRNINSLCELCGTKKNNSVDGSQVHWYMFPSAEQIKKKGLDKLKEIGLGYRAEYIFSLACKVANEEININDLLGLNYDEAMKYLQKIEGIGPKVANCICLFSLHHLEAFPIDIHVMKILKREYNVKNESQIDDFLNWEFSNYSSYRGLMQQYMFCNEVNREERYWNGLNRQYKKRSSW